MLIKKLKKSIGEMGGKVMENCPVCGTPCTIEGHTTLHYEPIKSNSCCVDWEKEFDREFSNAGGDYDGSIEPIKYFIRNLLNVNSVSLSVEEIFNLIHNELCSGCLGSKHQAKIQKMKRAAQAIHNAQRGKK